VLSLHVCYWHAANATTFLIMKRHKEIIVQILVQACLSAAGNKAIFMHSAFADVEILQFNGP
jgi:hypothetical protein